MCALFFVCAFAAKQLRRLVQEHERKGCGNTANVVGRHTQQSSINFKAGIMAKLYFDGVCVMHDVVENVNAAAGCHKIAYTEIERMYNEIINA